MRGGRVAVLAALLLTGCGTESKLAFVAFEPPAGSESGGQTSGQGTDPTPAGQPIFRFEAPRGKPLSYTVRVRNVSGEPVTVTGVRHDPDRGPFEEKAVAGAPLEIAPGAETDVTIEGRVDSCANGGEGFLVGLADPELELRTAGGETSREFDVTDTETQFEVTGCR